MRFIVPFVLIISMIIGCATKKPPVTEKEPDIVKEEITPLADYLWAFKPNINIRDNHSPSSSKIAQLSDGDSVIVMTNENGWYHIKTAENTIGWVRTDLLGPKVLSAFTRAVSYVDSLRDNEKTNVFFDKALYHKRIYISYPTEFYTSKSAVEAKTKKLIDNFQTKVYRGQVTARVLKPDSEEEYLTIVVNGEQNADPLLPVIPYGIIRNATPKYSDGIELEYEAPADIPDQQILATARKLSGSFPLTYQKIEITFISESESTAEQCRLWFMEDENGEAYKFNPCP